MLISPQILVALPEPWAAKLTLLHANALLVSVLSSQVSCGLWIRT
jgi:hypothetical protein